VEWGSLPDRHHVRAKDLGAVGWRRFANGETLKTSAEIHVVGPLYLRPSGPEIVLAQKLAQNSLQGSIKQGA
jgi:hypothetical protein